MAAFLLITTLMTIAGLLVTSIAGFMAGPGHVAQHIFFALATVIVGLFSQSMTMFFFIGTGKEIKDKVKGAAEEPAVIQRTKSFKSSVFPAAMWAMTAIMITFIMGGGVGSGKTPRWLHLSMSIATILLFARAYWMQIRAMTENSELMGRYLRE
jgi:hypothetical protein